MTRLTGKVKWFSTEKGYGFIEREGAEDVFVHRSEIQGAGPSILEEGEIVEFDVESSSRGLKARSVERAGSESPGRDQGDGARDPLGEAAGLVDGAGGAPPAESPLPTLEEQLTSRLVPRFLRRI